MKAVLHILERTWGSEVMGGRALKVRSRILKSIQKWIRGPVELFGDGRDVLFGRWHPQF